MVYVSIKELLPSAFQFDPKDKVASTSESVHCCCACCKWPYVMADPAFAAHLHPGLARLLRVCLGHGVGCAHLGRAAALWVRRRLLCPRNLSCLELHVWNMRHRPVRQPATRMPTPYRPTHSPAVCRRAGWHGSHGWLPPALHALAPNERRRPHLAALSAAHAAAHWATPGLRRRRSLCAPSGPALSLQRAHVSLLLHHTIPERHPMIACRMPSQHPTSQLSHHHLHAARATRNSST